MNNPCFTVCGIVAIQGKILLVRHTYGIAKGRILLPGGYVREGELPDRAVEREIWEETRITARAKAVLSLQFKPEQCCVAFIMEEASGTPISDGYENSEVLLLTAQEAVEREDITNLSREILTAYLHDSPRLERSDYLPAAAKRENYALFGA